MSRRDSRAIDRFDVRSNDGYEKTIIIWQDLIDAGTMQNPTAVIPGMKEARTIDGQACNRIDDDTFEIVSSGIKVQRIRQQA